MKAMWDKLVQPKHTLSCPFTCQPQPFPRIKGKSQCQETRIKCGKGERGRVWQSDSSERQTVAKSDRGRSSEKKKKKGGLWLIEAELKGLVETEEGKSSSRKVVLHLSWQHRSDFDWVDCNKRSKNTFQIFFHKTMVWWIWIFINFLICVYTFTG